MKNSIKNFYAFGTSFFCTTIVWFVLYIMDNQVEYFQETDFAAGWFVIVLVVIIWWIIIMNLYAFQKENKIHTPNEIVPDYKEPEITPEERDMLEIGMVYDERLSHPMDVADEYHDDGNWPEEELPKKQNKTAKTEPDETRLIWADPLM